MSAWTVWQIDRAGRPERVGSYAHGADARRVLRASITRGAVVDPEGEVDEARGVASRDVTAIEHAAEAWLATAPTAPAPAEVVKIPAPVEEDVEPVGVGAATEAPRGMSQTAIDAIREQYAHDCALPDEPSALLPEDVEPAPRSYAERVEDLRAEIARGRPSSDVEHLRVQLADATARAVAAEAARLELDVEHAADMVRVAERDRTIAALRAQLAQRDRTIANLRAELAEQAHPVVRIAAPRVRRVVRAETPVETMHRRLAEIAEGRR